MNSPFPISPSIGARRTTYKMQGKNGKNSLKVRVLARVAIILQCRDELIEELTEGALHFVGPSISEPGPDLGETEFEPLSPVSEHQISDRHTAALPPNRLRQNSHIVVPFSLLPAFLRRRYLKAEIESNLREQGRSS